MLQVADYMLRLHSLNEIASQCARKQWIFALVFKGAAVARLARQIDASAE